MTKDEAEYVRLTRVNLRGAGIRDTKRQNRAIRLGLARMRKSDRKSRKLSGRELPIPEGHDYVVRVRRELSLCGVADRARQDPIIRRGLARIVAQARTA